MEFPISQPKWSDCHETKSKHIDWTLGLKCDLGHDLDLEFSRSNIEFAISQPKMVRLPRNKKQIYRLNSRAQMWPSGLTLAMTLTLNFQGQIWNFLYLSQKWPDCHETKSKHIDWTLGLKCDHQFWPWIFKVKYGISYISAKRGPIATNRKQTYRLNSRPQMWPMGLNLTITLTFEFWRLTVTLSFDHTHDLDHGFSWSNFEIAVSQNGRADWHCTKEVAVGHSLPWSWPFGNQGQVYGSTR